MFEENNDKMFKYVKANSASVGTLSNAGELVLTMRKLYINSIT